jgi:hypothetical protein
LARVPIKIAYTLILHQSRSRCHRSPEMSRFLLSALVRDGGVVDGHHFCSNYWPKISKADRIAARRLRYLGSFAVCSPRSLCENGKWVGINLRSERFDIEITFPLTLHVCLARRPRPRWSSTDPVRRLKELKIVRRIPNRVGSSPTLPGTRPDLNITTLGHFLHWPHRALSWTGFHAAHRQSPFSLMRTNSPGLRITRARQPRQWLF